MIALGIPWKTTDKLLREYFEKFGEVVMCQVKCDQKTGQSKGFGFVRFKSPESQLRVLAQRHNIDGRWCEVQIPSSKEGMVRDMPSKVFVGRITEDMSADDIKTYFDQFGEVTDVYIPKPFRSFCFVTFLEPDTADKLWTEDHIIKGVTVHVSDAAPKNSNPNNQRNQNYGNQNYGNSNNGGGRFDNGGPRGGNNYGNNQGFGRKNNYSNDDRGGFGRNDNSNDSWNMSSNNRSNYDMNSGNISNVPNLPPAVVAAMQYMMGGSMPGGGNTDGVIYFLLYHSAYRHNFFLNRDTIQTLLLP